MRKLSEPERVRGLPVHGGYRVPWFVAWIDGKPDFRVVEPARVRMAVKRELCWICGGPLGVHKAFVVGPMCVVNRISAEPPQHKECAVWAAQVCPFLSDPTRSRRLGNLQETRKTEEMPGTMVVHNPGVVAVWTCTQFTPFTDKGGLLFELGPPHGSVLWFTKGRAADKREATKAFDNGLPQLQSIAVNKGPAAIAHLARAIELGRRTLPRGM